MLIYILLYKTTYKNLIDFSLWEKGIGKIKCITAVCYFAKKRLWAGKGKYSATLVIWVKKWVENCVNDVIYDLQTLFPILNVWCFLQTKPVNNTKNIYFTQNTMQKFVNRPVKISKPAWIREEKHCMIVLAKLFKFRRRLFTRKFTSDKYLFFSAQTG